MGHGLEPKNYKLSSTQHSFWQHLQQVGVFSWQVITKAAVFHIELVFVFQST